MYRMILWYPLIMLSVGTAAAQLPEGIDPCELADGECCVAHPTPGCTDPVCCDTVCTLDPFCCEREWDDTCVDLADANCDGGGFCGCQGDGDCCAVHPSTGCDDPACCDLVCQLDSLCCDVTWDALCVGLAETVCGGGGFCGACPGEGDCCAAHASPGCDDPACCAAVCAVNPICCGGDWTEVCALQANVICGGGGDDFCLGACCVSAMTCEADTSPSVCLAIGGIFQGAGVVCADVPDCNIGACCLSGGQCVDDQTPSECLAQDGTHQGFNTSCAAAQCPLCPGIGDCCEAKGSLGCEDADCCTAVCDAQSECCTQEWDQTCADLADQLCVALCAAGCPNPGDFDSDGDVDLVDFAQFQLCFTGSGGGPVGPECACADFEGDTDVDLVDFAGFQLAFTGST